ncbi:MAG: 4-hydroxy-tetrahydrodipicolinate reductase [Pseudomonadota bacterium]
MTPPLRILLAGVTGKTGRLVASDILACDDLQLVAAVSRSAAGRDLGEVFGQNPLNVKVFSSVAEALKVPSDVLIEYTSHAIAKDNVLQALATQRHVVIGTSGLTTQDYEDIDKAAKAAGRGVIVAGNYAMTATLMRRFALEAAKHISDVEVIDYASAQKPDVPSGTARELAEMLGDVRLSASSMPVDQLHGPLEARGAAVGQPVPVQVHSLRLPSYYISCEAIFGTPDGRLTIRYDAFPFTTPSPTSYIAGTLLAARKVPQLIGLHRGLEHALD